MIGRANSSFFMKPKNRIAFAPLRPLHLPFQSSAPGLACQCWPASSVDIYRQRGRTSSATLTRTHTRERASDKGSERQRESSLSFPVGLVKMSDAPAAKKQVRRVDLCAVNDSSLCVSVSRALCGHLPLSTVSHGLGCGAWASRRLGRSRAGCRCSTSPARSRW